MDRITFDGNFCDIAVCQEVPCKYPDTGCSQKQVWDRLKAIEDILGDSYDLDELRRHMGTLGLIGKTVYGIRRKTERQKKSGGKKINDSWIESVGLLRYGGCYVAEKICCKTDLIKLGSTVFLTRKDAEDAIGGAHNG